MLLCNILFIHSTFIELQNNTKQQSKDFTIWHMLGAKRTGAENESCEFWGRRVSCGLEHLRCLHGRTGIKLGSDRLVGAGQAE